jgi:hypothetical protein
MSSNFDAQLAAAKAARLEHAERLRAAMALVESAKADVSRAQAVAAAHAAAVTAQDRARFASPPPRAAPAGADFCAAEGAQGASPPPRAAPAGADFRAAEGAQGGAWEPPYAAPRAALGYAASLEVAVGAAPVPRGRVGVRFSVVPAGGGAPGESDFVALYAGAPPATPAEAHERHLTGVEFTDGAREGERALRLPSYAGAFCVCYVSACGQVLASSAPFEVGRGGGGGGGGGGGVAPPPPAAPAPAEPPPPAAPAPAEPPPPAPLPTEPPPPPPTEPLPPPPPPPPPAPAPAAARLLVRPPFLLETQPRISVLQLYVPLPASARGLLPAQWAPRVLIEGDGDGKEPALLLAFSLPAGGGYAGGAGGEGVLFALQLPLVRRVEAAKAALRVAADHVSLRLPFFYAGSALPERPPSLVSVEELSALRQRGWALACRLCGAPLLRGGGAEGAEGGRGGGASRAPPRVLQLPSEHWLEWAELWMCHEGQENVLLPRDGEGEHCGVRGVLLVGEAHLQAHAADVMPGALLLRRAASAAAAAAAAAAGGAGAPPASQLSVECARCGAALGRLSAPLSGAAAAALGSGGGAALLLSAPAAGAPAAGAPADFPALLPAAALAALPDALMAGAAHPHLRLFKDALWLPQSSPSPRPSAHAWAAGGGARGSGGGGALHPYTLCTRVAVPMLAAAQTMCRYRFLLVGEGAGGGPLLLATLINWNTSIRAAAECGEGGGGGEGAGAEGGAQKPWGLLGDLPCLKLRYEVLASGGGGGGGGGASGAAPPPPEGDPELLELAPAELAEVLAVLRETSLLLPPSARCLEGGEVGFLPFVAAPLKRIRR